VGSVPFKKGFRMLYDLFLDKDVTVAELYYLGLEKEGWVWRQRLLAWEEEFVE